MPRTPTSSATSSWPPSPDWHLPAYLEASDQRTCRLYLRLGYDDHPGPPPRRPAADRKCAPCGSRHTGRAANSYLEVLPTPVGEQGLVQAARLGGATVMRLHAASRRIVGVLSYLREIGAICDEMLAASAAGGLSALCLGEAASRAHAAIGSHLRISNPQIGGWVSTALAAGAFGASHAGRANPAERSSRCATTPRSKRSPVPSHTPAHPW